MLRFEDGLSEGWRRRRSVLGRTEAYSVMLGVLWLAVSLTARANVVADWDAIAAATITPPPGAVLLPAVTEAEQRPIFQADLASVHVAIYDAVTAIDRKHEPFAIVPKSKVGGSSQEAGMVGAAYGVLKGLFPGRSALYQSAYDSYAASAGADQRCEGWRSARRWRRVFSSYGRMTGLGPGAQRYGAFDQYRISSNRGPVRGPETVVLTASKAHRERQLAGLTFPVRIRGASLFRKP